MTAADRETTAVDDLDEDDTGGDDEADAPRWDVEDVDPETLAELHALLARCFEHPGEETSAAIRSGAIAEAIGERATAVGVDVTQPSPPARPREAYLRTFEGFEGGAYAPPAESVYEPWWDGTDRGILSGPPAHDMERRYEAIDIETPDAYPADHVALELEYASLLLEHGADEEYVDFVEAHFGWLPALRERVERTSDVAFHRWAVRTLETAMNRTVAAIEAATEIHEDDEQ